VTAVADRVRDARAAKRRLRVAGAGTWLDAGRPVAASETLSLADDRGIVEYVPGDLTLTARAGTRLADIVAATGAEGQWLPLDPWGGDAGTLGATLSTATAGPHAYSMGLPRDVVLGMEFVSGAGDVIQAGGRVVKNVAGFDLTRMMIGSWGTLGVITEATVRLRARPERTASLAIAVSSTHAALNDIATKLRALPFAALASEIVNGRLASLLGLGEQAVLIARVGGNEKSVQAQLEALRGLGDAREADESVWTALRTAAPQHASVWRWSQLPSLFGETWNAADRATRALGSSGVMMHGSPMRGVARVIATDTSKVNDAELTRAAANFSGTVNIESLPSSAWAHLGFTIASDPLSHSLRRTFNPGGTLNAGILGADE